MESLLKMSKFVHKVLRKDSNCLKDNLFHLLFHYFLIKSQVEQVAPQLKLQPKFPWIS